MADRAACGAAASAAAADHLPAAPIGASLLFLIAAEAISSDSGLGYRIFLVRRYLSMDVIFPYVAWITLLAVLTNFALDRLRIAVFPWSNLEAR